MSEVSKQSMEPISYEALAANNRHTHANLNFCIEEREKLRVQLRELEAVANGVIWLDNNIHNYGSDAWRGYFKAVLRDARRAMASPQSNQEGRPE